MRHENQKISRFNGGYKDFIKFLEWCVKHTDNTLDDVMASTTVPDCTARETIAAYFEVKNRYKNTVHADYVTGRRH